MRYLSYSLSTATLLCIQSTSRRSPRETTNKSRTDTHSHKAQTSANKIQTYNHKHNNNNSNIIIIKNISNSNNSSNSDNNGYESIKQTAAGCIFCVALCSGPILINGTLSLSLSQKVPAKDKATPGSTNDNRNKQLLKEKKQKKSTTNKEHIIHAKNLEHPDLQPKKSTAMATNPSKKTAAEQD
jgi:hypothetical protein